MYSSVKQQTKSARVKVGYKILPLSHRFQKRTTENFLFKTATHWILLESLPREISAIYVHQSREFKKVQIDPVKCRAFRSRPPECRTYRSKRYAIKKTLVASFQNRILQQRHNWPKISTLTPIECVSIAVYWQARALLNFWRVLTSYNEHGNECTPCLFYTVTTLIFSK